MQQREAKARPVDLPAADLARIKDLYLRGRYRAAYEVGAAHGPPRAWSGPAGRLIAGRLAMQLGAPKLGRRLHAVAFRESPAYPEAVYYHARFRLERFGPLACWRFCREHTDWSEAAPEIRGDWAALQAFVAARFRDFDRADQFLAQSEAVCPDRPWHFVERSSVLEAQDKPDDALAAARRSLELQPWFRPGVQAVAHLLARKGRAAEAVDLLTEASERLESGMVAAQLAALHLDLGHHAAAARSIERFADLSPLIEKDVAEWLAARRADVAYLLGDYAAAAEHAQKAGDEDEFYKEFAERLTGSPAPEGRKLLPLDLPPEPVPPSAHDLLGRFWNVSVPPAPADSPPLADGLPDPDERRRFDAAGWACREFTLTLDAVSALIARGVPFLLTLFETGFGQSRLVIGCDTIRQAVFLAEPSERKPVEAPLATVFERFAVTGPRCFVAVPPEHAGKLTGLDLPDAPLHDRLHAGQSHLADRRFADARAEFDRLTADAPTHTLARLAAVAWARATAHPVLTLDAADAMLAAHPHDPTFAMLKANALRELGRVHERAAFLRAEGERAEADPVLMQSHAQGLFPLPAEQLEAERLLRRSVRLRPHAPAGYFLLAALRWEHQAFDESVELHRIACCLDEREEQFAESYLRVARATGRLPEAVRLFQQRVRRADKPAPPAVRALVQALVERGEPEFARTALDKAIEKLTGTGTRNASDGVAAQADLRLHKAELLASDGRFADAEVELAAAEPHAPRVMWLKAAARVARMKPDYHAALARLKEVLADDPLNADAQRLCVALLHDVEGRAAARQYLHDVCGRYPHFYPALRLRAEFLTGQPDDTAVRATQDLLDLCPHDAWAHRQLALVYGDRRRPDEALAAVRAAGQYEPDHPSQFAVLANVLRRADKTDEAAAAFRDGLSGYIDHELAIAELVRTARGSKEKWAALRFVRDQLHIQPTNGEGLVAYRDQAMQLVTDPEEQEEVSADLERFLDDRPDLWQAWSVNVQQLLMTHRMEEAYALAQQATARFPLLARLWADQAEAARMTGRPEERIDALRKAVAAAPGWTPAARDLADALGEQDEFDAAVGVLERNAARAPLDPLAHGFLAERLWNSDRGAEAVRHAESAVRHEPGYDWAWGAVANWGERLGHPDAALDLARDLAKDRAGDARVFLKLARSLYKYEHTDEALAALDRAIALDPSNPEPYDLKAERLAEVGRFDEALAAAAPAELADDLPLILRGRAAWVEARRGNYSAAIARMQALVSVDEHYYWGWWQLADWYNETGKPEAYLEAAEQMVKLRPDLPTALTLRGEAKLQTDDRDGGKADLREALRMHPGYSPAAAILFDACLADDERKEARAALSVLQEHMTGPEVLVKQLAYAVHTGDEDGAVRAFADVCRTEGDGPPGVLHAAWREMTDAELEPRAIEAMEEAWRSGEPFNPWAALLWLDTPTGETAEPADRVGACDAVLKQYPGFIPGHDRKAEQLARLGRYDEAATACRAAPVNPLPLTLRGRAAWVEAMRGDRERAIDQMTACVTEDPDYTWGWRQLAHWYGDLGRPRDCLRATDHLVRLAPNDPVAFVLRGEAKRSLGDHRGALEDYRRAYDLDPQFDAAGHQLLSEQLATDDLSGAEKTLETLREGAPDGSARLGVRAVQLAARQRNLSAARSALRDLIADPKADRALVREAATALDDQGWAAEADEELEAAVSGDACTPAAAAAWAERHCAAGNGWKVADRLKQLVDRSPDAGREAALVCAWGAAVNDQPETATATVQRFADLIRQTDDGWGRAGAVLVRAKKYPLALAWLQDWEQRAGCEPWMLRAVAEAHRAAGNDADARRILIAAAELAEDAEEELPDDMRAWLALETALTDDPAVAREHLAHIDTVGLADAVALLVALAKAVLAVRTAANPSKAFADAKEDIRAAAGACPPAEVPVGLGRAYKRVVAKLTERAGLTARAWGWWQAVRPAIRG